MSEFLSKMGRISPLGSIKLAREVSKYCHQGQSYGEEDYFLTHIREVVDKTQNMYGFCQDFEVFTLTKIAYLHDSHEDSPLTIEDLVSLGFDSVVVNAVEAISKVKGQSYKEYIDKVKSDEYAFMVKVCDTLCNLEASILSGEQRRIEKYLKQLELLLLP